MSDDKETCRVCGGTGICRTCGGTGDGKSTNPHPTQGNTDSESGNVRCSICNGSGNCVNCGGTGKV